MADLQLSSGGWSIRCEDFHDVDVDPSNAFLLGPCIDGSPPAIRMTVSRHGRQRWQRIFMGDGAYAGFGEDDVICADDDIVLALGAYVACIHIELGGLLWMLRLDSVAVYSLYQVPGTDDLLVHGEISVSRISRAGEIRWQAHPSDVLAGELRIAAGEVSVRGYEGAEFQIDLASGDMR